LNDPLIFLSFYALSNEITLKILKKIVEWLTWIGSDRIGLDRTGTDWIMIQSDPITKFISTQNWKKEHHFFRPQAKVNKS